MAIEWKSGDTNVLSMTLKKDYLQVELIELNEIDEIEADCYLDVVRIPNAYINKGTYQTLLEQLISNDLKNVGYEYSEHVSPYHCKTVKTMFKTQIRGSLNLLLNELHNSKVS